MAAVFGSGIFKGYSQHKLAIPLVRFLDEGGGGGMGTIIQGIRNIFGTDTPRILSGACMLYGKTVLIWLALAMDIPISP